MERCTLCGGRLANGRCTECGLDNTKNDKKYHLNTHNEKATMFHRGKCEDNLNRDNDKAGKTQKNAKYVSYEKVQRAGKASGDVFGGSIQGKESKAQRAKKLKERRQTGTVKKKGGAGKLVRWIVILIVVFEILAGLIGAVVENIPDFFEERFGSFFEENEDYNGNGSSKAPAQQKPSQESWDEAGDAYFEAELTTGIYNVGYELPAGRYQLYCDAGNAWINWWNPEDEYSHSIYLRSVESQSYQDDNDRNYFELSEVLELRTGAVIYVEDCEQNIRITGQSEGTVKEHKMQQLSEEITVENNMTAGEDFQAGVYDVTLVCEDVPEGEYCSASLIIKDGENGGTYFVSVDRDQPVFYRFPFREKSTVELETYGTETAIKLIPSY